MNKYLSILILFAIISVSNLVWFKLIVPKYYKPVVDDMNKSKKYKLEGALFVWMCLAIGIYMNIRQETCINNAILRGSFFGFLAYGIHNGSNYATSDLWTGRVWVMDNAWGTFVCGLAASLMFLLSNK
jgi:uncharacterized membrane protein